MGTSTAGIPHAAIAADILNITSQLIDKTIAKFGGKPIAVSDIGIMPD